MRNVDFISDLHYKASRNYLERVIKYNKPECAEIAKRLDNNYWDGDRRYGYGGYYYDGRWKKIAQNLIDFYRLKPDARILDIGCGKGFLIYEMKKIFPELEIRGLDVSEYAVENSKEEISGFISLGTACRLPFPDNYFDLVLSINTLHYLYIDELEKAIYEIERVKRKDSYLVVESYRNETEKNNLLCWQLTCECFFTPREWEWLFRKFSYRGDYSFVFFP